MPMDRSALESVVEQSERAREWHEKHGACGTLPHPTLQLLSMPEFYSLVSEAARDALKRKEE